ncbi:MAG: chemotaxis response regulator protein-glutamate methylesterase [Treponema sp.]|mgnify:CR=1 FL=1|nr:chemotaxis response regulator protein-glutamate methylesterase [Treponema sp.]
MENISVAICDDSALMRNLIGRIIEETEGLSICFKAQNGQDLLDKLSSEKEKPDVILLDIEMPVMTGVQFLQERRSRGINVPVIVISSIATEGAAVTMQCLSLGASDFVTKPGGTSVSLKIGDVSRDIVENIASYGGRYARRHGKNVYDPEFFDHQLKLKEAEKFVQEKKGSDSLKSTSLAASEKPENKLPPSAMWRPYKPKEKVDIKPLRDGGKIEVIAIGISTGGPNALRDVFKAIDAELKQPVLVVQHMPAGFTKEFAASLNSICPLTVTEAVDGELILNGHVYIAPGNKHILVEHHATGNIIKLSDAEQRNGHRPSADVLFESVAKVYQNRALGVIMTGMGRDGAAELAEMRKQGAWTLGQDQDSSIVYGMPRVAWELGGVQKQVPLQSMAAEISAIAKEHLYN